MMSAYTILKMRQRLWDLWNQGKPGYAPSPGYNRSGQPGRFHGRPGRRRRILIDPDPMIQSDEESFDLEGLRERLRRMDDAMLLRWGKAAAELAGQRAVFRLQAEAAREEWRRRRREKAARQA
jgi:hypothetical protein